MSKHQAPVEIRTIEEARGRVLTMVADQYRDDVHLSRPVMEQCVSDAVTNRWEGVVSNFVPILAYREVQECIRLGYCPERSPQ